MNNIIAPLFRAFFRIPIFRDTFFGVNKRIFRRYNMFYGWKKQFKFRNLTIEANLSDWIPQNLYFYNEYEEKELKFLENTLKVGDTFVDVGANIGLFSLVASQCVGKNGRVLSFEPYKASYDNLLRNASINNLTNITAEQMAIGAKAEIITLYTNVNDHDPGMVSRDNMSRHYQFTHSQISKSVALDEYLKEKQTPSVRMIKIDIEGYEGAALDGMRQTLATFRPILLIEVLDGLHIGEHNVTHIDNLLLPFAYKRYYINSEGILTSSRTEDDKTGNVVYKAD